MSMPAETAHQGVLLVFSPTPGIEMQTAAPIDDDGALARLFADTEFGTEPVPPPLVPALEEPPLEAFAETLTVVRRVCLVYARTWWPVNINADADDFAWLDGDPAIAYLHYGSDRKIRLRRPRVVPG